MLAEFSPEPPPYATGDERGSWRVCSGRGGLRLSPWQPSHHPGLGVFKENKGSETKKIRALRQRSGPPLCTCHDGLSLNGLQPGPRSWYCPLGWWLIAGHGADTLWPHPRVCAETKPRPPQEDQWLHLGPEPGHHGRCAGLRSCREAPSLAHVAWWFPSGAMQVTCGGVADSA